MRKSVKGFILGLLGGLGGLLVSWYTYIILAIFGALASRSVEFLNVITITILPWAYGICAAVSIMASFLCLRWARVGGIVLLVMAAVMLILPICVIIIGGKSTTFVGYLFMFLPILFIMLAGISAVKAKPKIKEAV